ncbi:hypothetical protein [Nesterenkonia sp. HG001]|nr:hypothetical protein [Nesterenkonia sp. HG001]MDZ5078148.1 hypothetical protein [Nesterenkonia sp. HG001]
MQKSRHRLVRDTSALGDLVERGAALRTGRTVRLWVGILPGHGAS